MHAGCGWIGLSGCGGACILWFCGTNGLGSCP